ncbi:putative porin [Cesiribacter andamanensis]|uniref:putative porin n=1 Tax=Cesiribacter andamanensis TaxID=649507 RepID=UPI001378F607|nr:putative porin [Cesiribacter andamanensis]
MLLALPLGLQAQIVDDSTRLVYGPQTTTYVRESSLYYQSGQTYHPDTAVRNFYRLLPTEQSGYRLQDLGNVGTAMQPIYYTPPQEIGARSGFTVYDYWFNDAEEIRYYNTRSPYTRLFYSQGGNGRSWVDVTHARNVTPRWNVGGDFRRITADKQIGPTRTRDEKQTVSTAYDLFTWYKDSVDRYQLMANLSRMRHRVQEPGGILVSPTATPATITDIIRYADSPIRRATARSEELRLNYHLYHQYKLASALQLYHIVDRSSSTNLYEDQQPDSVYYRTSIPANYGTYTDEFTTRILQNQGGIKGGYGAGQWNAYIKHRAIRFLPGAGEEEQINEVGAGGYLALQPDTIRTLRLEAEVRTDGQYRFEALAQNNWLQLRYQRSQYKPAFIYGYRNTLVNEWQYEFKDPIADRLEGTLLLNLGPLRLQPGLSLAIVQNPLYLRAEGLNGTTRPIGIQPVQGAAAQILSPRLRFGLSLGHFHWDADAQYTLVTGNSAEAFQVPDWLVNSSLYFEGPLFGGNLIGQLGVDVHLKAAYYADAYDPALRQFVVQQDFLVPSYPIANLFFGFKVNRTRIFARMSHLNQGMTAAGYFPTPYYSGLQRTFDLGIDWLFFD